MKRRLFVAMLLGGLLPSSPAAADYPFTYDQGRRCAPEVTRFLQDLEIPEESIERITFREKTSPSLSFPRLIGFEAWVRPRDIKGYLVIVMGLGCGIQRAYTTGDYEVEGVR
jgi:hypothetical protein